MPHRRPVRKGSFEGHFDDLVAQFPDAERKGSERKTKDPKLKEKIDIHGLLFERAWQMERAER